MLISLMDFHFEGQTKRLKTAMDAVGTFKVNPYPAKLINLNFHSLEVVRRYRDPQLQVSENY